MICLGTADHLAYVMKTFIRDVCKSFPSTNFIYRSLLPTNESWLNIAVNKFNFNMFYDSINVMNFNYFDTYFVNTNPNLLSRSGNGIHITHDMIQCISLRLITHINHCISQYSDTTDIWPLRPVFRDILRERRMVGR